jgi:zinc protease
MRSPGRSEKSRPAAICAGLGVLALLSFGPASAKAELFDAESFTLENGLEIVVLPKHLAPVVYQMVVYKVGAADGEPGKNGIAHFLEHLMFKATAKLKAGEFSQTVDRFGGSDNAFTSQDITAYHQEIAATRLGEVMAMEADRMVNLRLDDATVLPERDVILNERSQNIDNNPGSRLSEAVNAALFRNHPYGKPVIGWRHEMETYSTADAQNFYARWYAPNNAILVVAGDVTADEVKRLAETHFGPIARKDVPQQQRLSEPPPIAERRLSLASPETRYPSVSRSYIAPSYRSAAASPETANAAYALTVLSEILDGGMVGRLHRRLVVEQGIAISAGAGYSGDARDYGRFFFYASPRNADALAAVEAALDAEIVALLKDGITAAELAAAKQRLQIASVKARDSLSGPAQLVANALGTGQSLAELQAWSERVETVTAEDVMAAARDVLIPANSVTAILTPEDAAPQETVP